MGQLTHFDDQGRAVMVDVGDKVETERTATASGRVQISPETLRLIQDRGVAKGDVLSVAQLPASWAPSARPIWCRSAIRCRFPRSRST